MIYRAKKNTGVDFDDTPNLLCHAFRRIFNTILKLRGNAKVPIIERLIGYDMKLDNSYFQPTLDDLFNEYQKEIPNLLIDCKERILEEIEIIEKEKSQLEESDIPKDQLIDVAKKFLKLYSVHYLTKRNKNLLNKLIKIKFKIFFLIIFVNFLMYKNKSFQAYSMLYFLNQFDTL